MMRIALPFLFLASVAVAQTSPLVRYRAAASSLTDAKAAVESAQAEFATCRSGRLQLAFATSLPRLEGARRNFEKSRKQAERARQDLEATRRRIEAARRELAADHAPPTRLERGAGAVTHRLTAHGRWVLSYLARVRRDREEWSSLVALKRDATFPRHCALRPPGSLVRSRDGCVQRPSPHCAEWSHSEEPVIEEVGWETKRNYIDVDHPPLEVLAGGSLVYGG